MEAPFNSLEGKVVNSVLYEQASNTGIKYLDFTENVKYVESLIFVCNDGTAYKMYHDQDCCETVYLEDVCGSIEDILNTPILEARESSSKNAPAEERKSATWTFYHIVTINGFITFRWCGTSNGYYSEKVSFIELKHNPTAN